MLDDYETLSAVAIQPDGKIVVAGRTCPGGLSNCRFARARYQPNGDLDPAFGSDGKVETRFDLPHGGGASPRDMALQPDGRIIVAGAPGFLLARYLPDGSLDETFGDGGKVLSLPGNSSTAWAMALTDGGAVIVAGTICADAMPGSCGFGVARYDAIGALDPTFGMGGFTVAAFATGHPESDGYAAHSDAYAVAVQPDGGIVAAGVTEDVVIRAVTARFTADGTLDSSFGTGGVFMGMSPNGPEGAQSAVATPPGGILTAGYEYRSLTGLGSTITRLNLDGTPDLGFGSGGTLVFHLAAFGSTIDAITLQSDGDIVAVGTAYDSYDYERRFFPTRPAVSRLHPDGVPDETFGEAGHVVFAMHPASPLEFVAGAATDASSIVVAGVTCASAVVGDCDFAVVRLTRRDCAPCERLVGDQCVVAPRIGCRSDARSRRSVLRMRGATAPTA